MTILSVSKRNSIWRKAILAFVLVAFLLTSGIAPSGYVYAQETAILLPAAGSMLNLSPVFAPPLLKGIKVYRNDPFRFDFILDTGDTSVGAELVSARQTDDNLRLISERLIKYFLASLTVPEKDLWVNLSPYEKDRIVPEAFGQTEMGRDLLAQDYILKQITASVIYPEGEVGKEFWAKVYAEAQKRYGSTDVPVDTFNKVWIIPEKATVYENKDAAFVVESKLKVMLEEDYLALEKNTEVKEQATPATNKLGSDIVREVVIPILEKEVNEGKNFAPLRQVYHSLILATWYKRKVKESILGKAYVDQKKTAGIDIADKNEKEKIWNQYVEAFKKGAYNLIKEEYDPATQQSIPRKYFSGGTDLTFGAEFQVKPVDPALLRGFSSKRAKVLKTRADPAMNHGEVALMLADSTIAPTNKGEVLANLVQGDASIRRGLNQSRERINDFDLNTQYFVDVDGGHAAVSISFVLKELHIIGRDRKSYSFYGAGVEDSGRLSLDDFLKMKLDTARGVKPVTMESVLKEEGLLRYFEHGLPIERGGALLYNERTKRINVHEHTANAVYSVARVEFDKSGRLLSTGINSDSMWEMPQESYETKILGFHFHPEDILQPSVADAEIIIRKNRPELIIGPSGRGAIWFVKDLEEGRRISKSPNFQRLETLSLSTQKDVLLRFLDFVEVDLNNPAQGAVSPKTTASSVSADGAKDNVVKSEKIIPMSWAEAAAELRTVPMESTKKKWL